MRPIEFTDELIDEAERMRGMGEKWSVIEMVLGAGTKQACYRRRIKRGIPSMTEEEEIRAAVLAWDGVGDRESFICGYVKRARRNQGFSYPWKCGATHEQHND